MTFTDREFFYFIIIVFFTWRFIRHREEATVVFLLIASFVFYGHKHLSLLPLLVLYCVVNWALALMMDRSTTPKRLLWWGIALNLVTLGYFKYTPLILSTIETIAGKKLWQMDLELWEVPYGISFFTFTSIAYLVDVYRKIHPAVRSLGRYSLSAAFFPHLVAGPILRPNEFLNHLGVNQLPTEMVSPREAMALIARGFFKKMVLADRIAEATDPYFAHIGDSTTAGVWSLPYVYLYALRIYFDFSAYTDIARGLAMLFGYRWPENFNLPYLALNIADFWRRWHMSLSRFLRDYLYIPLGGNRGGWWSTNRNLMLTMLLGGLWHGAKWSFLVWGGLHGCYLIIHRYWRAYPLAARWESLRGFRGYVWMAVCWLLTFHAVCLAWCFFRLTQINESVICVQRWVDFIPARSFTGSAWDASLWCAILGYLGLLLLIAFIRKSSLLSERSKASFDWGYSVGLLLIAILLAPPGNGGGFIYFQF